MLVIVVAIFAPHLSIHDPYEMNFDSRLELPSKSHWLGTDNFGRDLWSRIALGTRVSAIIAILSVSVSAILGTLVGLYAGYKGGSTTRILFVHILRNIWGPPLVFGTLSLGTAILTETALSFLGFGASPPTPTWGWIMAYGLRYIQTVPWFSIVPGLAIMITVLGFNLLGDGLQEYLDPKNHTL
jgi:peptide/nickel transport system permease protein